MVERTCHHCGKVYQTIPSIRLKYCSQTCSGAAKRRGSPAICANCNQKFYKQRSHPNAKYCSISCGISARNRTDLNPSYHRDVSGANNPMYGVRRLGADNPMYGKTKGQAPRWKGGRRDRGDGYTYCIAPDNHPYPAYSKKSGTKYILEHRYVMEQHIGRYLEPQEVVHHIDENPRNNHISNLRLFKDQAEHMRIGHPERS